MLAIGTITYGGKGPLFLGITWFEAILAIILIAMRAKAASLCTTSHISSGLFGFRWDFIWAAVAFTFALVAQVSFTVSVRYGLGNHQNLISSENLAKLSVWDWVCRIVSTIDLTFSRIAVIALLLSIQDRVRSRSRYFLYFLGATQTIVNVVATGFVFTQCKPIASLSDPIIEISNEAPNEGLFRSSVIGYTQAAIGAISDFILAAYPIFLIRGLRLVSRATKFSLCLVMGGGFVPNWPNNLLNRAGISSILKLIATSHIDDNSKYNTYTLAEFDTWVLTEMWFIIIFGSIPVLRAVFKGLIQDIKDVANRHNYSKNFLSRDCDMAIGGRGESS